MIVTTGSRGDVAPYLGLGRHLADHGHQVAIAAHDTFEEMVRETNLEWRRIPGDPNALIAGSLQRQVPGKPLPTMSDFLDGVADGIVDAAGQGTDVMVTCLGQAPVSLLVADALGVPSLGAYLIPSIPTDQFALPRATWSGAGHRADGRRMMSGARRHYIDVLPRLARRLGLASSAVDGIWERWLGDNGWPICLGYSPSVVPRPSDWPSNVEVTGYWWPPVPADWAPDPVLVEFLEAGPEPVFVGFGSMVVDDGDRLGPLVAEAVSTAGVRAVVQAGWAGLAVAGDNILSIGSVPHEWLLPRTCAAVHHAGAGTTGAVLRAGVPAVPVPVTADQPYWAQLVHELGSATAPMPYGQLTSQGLARAITEALSLDHARVDELARSVKADDGAGQVLSRINALVQDGPY
nr:glycosyltransferase [Kineosporia mesophila]